MKRIFLLTVTVFFSIINSTFSDPSMLGELKFEVINGLSGRFNLTVSTSYYSWGWDKANSSFIPVVNYNRNLTNIQNYAFDAPNDKNGAEDFIVWGLLTFTIQSLPDMQDQGDLDLTFTLDLRDEYWCHNQTSYPGSDTHIQIDQTNGKVYIIYAGGGTYGGVMNNDTLTIWDIWNSPVLPKQNNFTIPVLMKNRIENQNFDFGFLYANDSQVNSGGIGNYPPNHLSQTASVGSVDYIYTGNRNYNYMWAFSENNLTHSGEENLYDDQFNFFIQYDANAKFITRHFRKVYPLTIKTSLDELGGISAGNLWFKDPTTTNTFEPQDATGANGFYKDNAFNDLHIDLLPLTNQQYSVKANNLFNYNGRNYQYSYGDYNTSANDFLVTAPTIKVAHYKGTQLSNQTNAIAGNGQKKIVKTSDGYLHQSYESLNRVWYERSTDSGTTWEIMNGAKPISGSYYSKQPSMDYYNTVAGKVLVIVYQAYDENGSSINASIFKDGSLVNTYVLVSYSHSIGVINEVNTTPVVSINPDGKLLFVWSLNDAPDVIFNSPAKGIYYRYANLYFNSGYPLISWYTAYPVILSRTSIASINPALDVYKTSVQPFQLAYENSNQIHYRTLTDDANQTTHLNVSSAQFISTGSGYTYNNKPSILAWNGGSRVVWEGNNSGYKKRVIFRSPSTYYFWSFNNSGGSYDCLSPNINRPDNYSTYYFSWSENNAGIMNNNSLSYAGIKNLGISGQYIQLNNGATPGAMYATTLNSSATPYSFTKSVSLGSFYGLLKSSGLFAGSEGRRGVVYKDSAEFYFNFGKITVDDNNIGYVQIDETKDSLDEKTINQYLTSQPFNLSDNSSFSFNIQYAVTDTVNANAVLEEDDYVSFKLQLVDYATSAILGEYDNVKFTKSNLSDHNNLDYLVNTNGIGNKTVILKLVAETNFEASYALTLENSGGANENLNSHPLKTQISFWE